MVGVRFSLILEASWDFFLEWRPKQIVLIHFLEYQKMQFHCENNNQTKKPKKPQELVWKFIEKHLKIHGTKVP